MSSFMPSASRFAPLLPCFALAALCCLSQPSQAGERYFMLIFAAQSHPRIPRLTHTFATIVRVAEAPGCPTPCVDAYTISWLPQTLTIHPYRLRDEPGVNLTLEQTLRWSYDHRMNVYEWGPYEIDAYFFTRVYREYARFESGEFRYKAIDPKQRGARTADCIHAVTDIDGLDNRGTYPVLISGVPATRKFVRVLTQRGRLRQPCDDTCWLQAALGLNCYPIIRQPTP
jgi:hypothetical protein